VTEESTVVLWHEDFCVLLMHVSYTHQICSFLVRVLSCSGICHQILGASMSCGGEGRRASGWVIQWWGRMVSAGKSEKVQ